MISIISEDEQSHFLDAYNKQKPRVKKIPLMDRNPETGWPLLQVSLFTPTSTDHGTMGYEPVLGGGDCHVFFTAAYALATLLLKTPGKAIITNASGKILTPSDFSIHRGDHLHMLLQGYTFKHPTGIEIQTRDGYGATKILDILLPREIYDETSDKTIPLPMTLSHQLSDNLSMAFAYILDDTQDTDVEEWGSYHQQSGYSEEQINDAIRKEMAVFDKNKGQIYMDLGCFLTEAKIDPLVIQLFSLLFRVPDYLRIQQDYRASLTPADASDDKTTLPMTDETAIMNRAYHSTLQQLSAALARSSDASVLREREAITLRQELKMKLSQLQEMSPSHTAHFFHAPSPSTHCPPSLSIASVLSLLSDNAPLEHVVEEISKDSILKHELSHELGGIQAFLDGDDTATQERPESP